GAVVLAREEAESQPVPADLRLVERIDLFCRHRAQALETLAPAASAARLRSPFSKQLQRNRARHLQLARHGVEQAFAPEFNGLGATGPDLERRRADVVLALTVATT